MLNLAEKLTLVSFDESKGKLSFRNHNVMRFGLKGAIALKLCQLGKIRFENSKIILTDTTSTGDAILDNAVKVLGKKQKPVSLYNWIYGFSIYTAQLKKDILMNLVDNAILREEEKRFLGLFPMKRYSLTNREHYQRLSSTLREVLINNRTDMAGEDQELVTLYAMCGYYPKYISNAERKEHKEKIKSIKKLTFFKSGNKNLEEVVKAIKKAIASQAATGS